MKKITIALPDKVLRDAQVRAAREGTSIRKVVRNHLEQYALEHDRLDKAIDRILELSDEYGKGRRLKRWTREELHDRNASH
jgi:plasmid stability protein